MKKSHPSQSRLAPSHCGSTRSRRPPGEVCPQIKAAASGRLSPAPSDALVSSGSIRGFGFRFGEAWRGRRVRKWLETPAQAPVVASPPAVQRTLPTAADSFDSAATVLPLNFPAVYLSMLIPPNSCGVITPPRAPALGLPGKPHDCPHRMSRPQSRVGFWAGPRGVRNCAAKHPGQHFESRAEKNESKGHLSHKTPNFSTEAKMGITTKGTKIHVGKQEEKTSRDFVSFVVSDFSSR